MFPCNVCTDIPLSPVCLPCGHIFCNDCIIRVIRSIAPLTTLHHCHACQTPYSTATLDAETVPPHLRANLLPSVRRLQPSDPVSAANIGCSSASSSSEQIEIARLRAENAAMQKNCAMWRKRAEAHSSSTLGLLQLVRMTRDQAMEAARQRDELRRKCEVLQKRLDDEDEDEDTFETGEQPFLPVDILDQIDKLSSPASMNSGKASSPGSGLGLSGIKRVRTPYESPSHSDAEDEDEPRKKRGRSSRELSPLSF